MPPSAEPLALYAEPEAEGWLGDGLTVRRIERRRDALVSRRRWQFGLRDELVAVPGAYGSEDAPP